MIARDVVIALDQGSSSSRALAFDLHGRVAARAQFPIRTHYPEPGWAEHDPEEIARTQERALDAVLRSLPRATRVAAVGLATQRSTVVLWDAGTGRSLCRAPSWQDGRAAAVVAPLQDRQAWAHERTGLYLTPYYSAPKIRWLLDNAPAARAAAAAGRLRIGPVGSFLLWRLTRGEVFASDPTLAQRMMLLNLRTLAWDPELLALFGVPADSLPALRPSTGELAVIQRGGRRLPVVAMLGDQQSAAASLGGGAPGAGVLNYGTGAFFLLHTGSRQHRVPGLLTSVAWQRGAEPCEYFQEGTVHAAATSFHWLKENLGLLDSVDAVDAHCRRSRSKLLALQAIGGLGAPRWDYRTPTAFYGLTSQTRPSDVVRAVTEGIAYLLADIVRACRSAGLPAERLWASGGLSRVAHLLQFQADILQQPVARVKEAEATAAGVAALAAKAAGLPWAGGSVRVDRRFTPGIAAGRAEKLLEGWKVFVEAQQRLGEQLQRLGLD